MWQCFFKLSEASFRQCVDNCGLSSVCSASNLFDDGLFLRSFSYHALTMLAFDAGNSSQVSDGAGAVLLMKRRVALEKKLPILGAFRFVWAA